MRILKIKFKFNILFFSFRFFEYILENFFLIEELNEVKVYYFIFVSDFSNSF